MTRARAAISSRSGMPRAAPGGRTRPALAGAGRTSTAQMRRRIIAAARDRLGTSTWPAYGAAGFTAAYGTLKAYWVLGGTALWSIAPLSPEMIDKARSHTAPTWFEVADAITVVLGVAGVLFALATLHPRRRLPVRLVRWTLWPLATFMVLRALLSIPGDVQQIATGGSGQLTRTAWWDLVLWSPSFLLWGLLWAGTALTYEQRVTSTRD